MYNYYTNSSEVIQLEDGTERVKSRFFFFMASPPVTGGDLVTVDHARKLRQAGVDARILFLPNKKFGNLHSDFPADIPINLLSSELILTPTDFVVVGESQAPVYRDMNHWFETNNPNLPKFIMFNQAVHWTAYAFKNRQYFNSLHFAGLICASNFVKNYMQENLGLEINKVFKAVHVVCPATSIPAEVLALPSSTSRAEKKKKPKCRISFIQNPRKRADEINTLKFMFTSLYPDYADKVEFVKIDKKTHRETLEIMRSSDIFISSGYMDSHNLPAVEAMACGCHVVGYTGLSTPVDYFNSNNGWWFEQEGQLNKNVLLLKMAVDLYYSTDKKQKEVRQNLIANGEKTVKELFSETAANTQIIPAYQDIWQKAVAPYYGDVSVFASKSQAYFKN
ncbi:hypothetical protein CKF54_05470 [Psittacicella hinzii]|uniref:Glycosyl transferase family 1 domain-containing protein n=1 Tax=Psittacicella hinzii TaxID=2028575 RepID=A0A3A1Y489_9GAMM|nr:glycosyltransferase [Psittacicella hinzii]RIY32038.1 hypothetical protein CKF54_05470 [Psittacicella hinzii]